MTTGVVMAVCYGVPGLMASAWSDIVKWVDEDGKVHYGDRVPDQYKEKAEVIEKDEVQFVGPEEDVRRQNQQYSSSLRQQDRAEQQRKNRVPYESNDNDGEHSIGITQEDCRNRFPNNVKMRTQCFKDANKSTASE